jgi:putative membrane protein insertion efficiency factor
MGHRHSSAQCHDAGCLCLDGGGARGDAAGGFALNATAGDGHTLVRTEIRTADSSLHGRPVRESTDWKEEALAVTLGMTTLEAANEGDHGMATALGRSLRGASRGAAAELLLFGIRFYQAVFARLMPVGCKFYPTCSHYAAEAIERHGAARGARLALARLWRCRPFTQGGFDPVPDAHEVSNGAAEAASLSANQAEGGARAEASS